MLKTVLKQIGGLQVLLGGTMSLPMLVSLIYTEYYSALGFLVSGLIILTTGTVLFRGFSGSREPKNKDALIIAASGWLLLTIMGAIPFMIIAYITPDPVLRGFIPADADFGSSLVYFKNPLHALFESMSAFTTTGLTMAVHEPTIGKGLLFYRSFAQWFGGAGVIVLSLAILHRTPGQGALLLYGSEASGEKLKPNVIGTARAIWKVYVGITALVTVYLVVGTWLILPDYGWDNILFDAVNHAMTGQSTGGFSTLDDSIAGYNSMEMDILYFLPMIMGALSIPFYFKVVFERKFDLFWKDIQTRALLIASVLGGVLLSLLLFRSGLTGEPFRVGMFQFISALSTTGWQTSDIGSWDDSSVAFIVCFAMFIGGAAGATVGGIKVIRSLIIVKGVRWQISKVFLPENSIKKVKFGGKVLLGEEMNRELAQASTFSFIYIVFVLVSTLLTTLFMGEGFTISDALFEAASAQGTVGLSSGITVPEMSPVLETVYILQMWAGRIEIIPVLVLIRAFIWGGDPRMI